MSRCGEKSKLFRQKGTSNVRSPLELKEYKIIGQHYCTSWDTLKDQNYYTMWHVKSSDSIYIHVYNVKRIHIVNNLNGYNMLLFCFPIYSTVDTQNLNLCPII